MESIVDFYQETLRALVPLSTFERAEMSVDLARSFERACVAFCAGSAPVLKPQSAVPSVGSQAVYRTCGSPSRSLGSHAATGSGYWSVPSGATLSSDFLKADGKCYLAMASKGCRSSLYRRLGPWPTFARVLASPSGKFSLDVMGDSSLVRVSDGTWHVAGRNHHEPLSTANVDVATLLTRLVEDNAKELCVESAKWDGTLLRDLQLMEPALGSMDVPACGDKIGGLGEPPSEWEMLDSSVGVLPGSTADGGRYGGDSFEEAGAFDVCVCLTGDGEAMSEGLVSTLKDECGPLRLGVFVDPGLGGSSSQSLGKSLEWGQRAASVSTFAVCVAGTATEGYCPPKWCSTFADRSQLFVLRLGSAGHRTDCECRVTAGCVRLSRVEGDLVRRVVSAVWESVRSSGGGVALGSATSSRAGSTALALNPAVLDRVCDLNASPSQWHGVSVGSSGGWLRSGCATGFRVQVKRVEVQGALAVVDLEDLPGFVAAVVVGEGCVLSSCRFEDGTTTTCSPVAGSGLCRGEVLHSSLRRVYQLAAGGGFRFPLPPSASLVVFALVVDGSSPVFTTGCHQYLNSLLSVERLFTSFSVPLGCGFEFLALSETTRSAMVCFVSMLAGSRSLLSRAALDGSVLETLGMLDL